MSNLKFDAISSVSTIVTDGAAGLDPQYTYILEGWSI